jgi:hypothetical protein
LGLENWLGFALFLSSTLLTSACIYVINCQGKPSKFLQGGITELVNPGQDNAFTFVLVWTLFYGLSVLHSLSWHQLLIIYRNCTRWVIGSLFIPHGG